MHAWRCAPGVLFHHLFTPLLCLLSPPRCFLTPLQGTQHERELAAGGSRALRWADALRPLRLCVRVQEAGWLWSGGFQLDTPGDLFIKIRWVVYRVAGWTGARKHPAGTALHLAN